mgnify:CR=1 FL=1
MNKLQAEYVLDKMASKDEINVVIFKGEKNHSATKGRTEALKTAFKNSGKKVNIVFEDYADWSTDKAAEMLKKPNYLTVPAAIRELEKIEMTRQLDKIYRLDHAVSKTQKVVLSAFGISAEQVKYKANYISENLRGK